METKPSSQTPITRREMLAMSASAAFMMLARSRLSTARVGESSTSPELEAALGAARWIRRARIETRDGVTWPADVAKPESVGADLFDGASGVVLFYLELYDATRDSAWLDDARRGANDLIARLPALQQTESCGLYDGLAGVAFVLEETHRATGDGRYRDAAKRAISMIHGLARKTTSGAAWSGRSEGPDIVSGAAGIGLFLLWADTTIDDAESRAIALAAGRRLLETGIPDRGGTKWVSPSDRGVSFPNFAHGTAGVSYFLAELLRTTGDRTCMAGALSGARYLESLANHDRDGFKVCHHEPGGEKEYELGWCHGPAGTARLFHELGVVTGRSKWSDLAHACARSIIASDAPDGQSTSPDQCSGAAGIGEFFIGLQRAAPNASYTAMLSRVSKTLLSGATPEGDGRKWPQAESSALVSRTGFMRGAAGVGTYFLHADALAAGRTPSIHWPDSPWARSCAAPRAKTARDMSDLDKSTTPSC